MEMHLNYDKLYERNIKTALSFYEEVKTEYGFLEYLRQNKLENSPDSFALYFEKSINDKVDERFSKNEMGYLLDAYISIEHPEYTEGQTAKHFFGMNKDKQEEIKKMIQEPENKKRLMQIYKVRCCSGELANIYYRTLIEKEFNKVGNFKSSSFTLSKDVGNCAKGISAALLGALNRYIDVKSLSQSKEDWGHPDSLYKTVTGCNNIPELKKLEDVMKNDNPKKGDVFIVNGHHAMLYTGKVDANNKPLCHQFSPEAANYPLKLDKDVYVAPISSFVSSLDDKNANKIIEEMLETVENNVNQQDFKQMFLVNLKLEEARYKIENKNNQKSINEDKMQTTPNKKINPLLMKLKMSKQR